MLRSQKNVNVTLNTYINTKHTPSHLTFIIVVIMSFDIKITLIFFFLKLRVLIQYDLEVFPSINCHEQQVS